MANPKPVSDTRVKYLIALILIALVCFMLAKSEYVVLLKNATALDYIFSIIICTLIFTVTGLKIRYLAIRQFNRRILPMDVTALPIMMNLTSFFVPFKGGLLFQIFFLKMKYHINFAAGISISAYNQLMTLILYGMLGLLYLYSQKMLFSIGAVICLLLIFSPFIITCFHKLFLNVQFEKGTLPGKFKSAVDSIILNHNELWSDKRIVFTLFMLSVVHTVARILWVAFSVNVFSLEISFLTIITMALLTELSIIFRFVPGNLGVYELFSAGAFKMLGEPMESGILIALFLRLTGLIVTFPLGMLALQANLKNLGLTDIGSIWKTLKNSYNNI